MWRGLRRASPKQLAKFLVGKERDVLLNANSWANVGSPLRGTALDEAMKHFITLRKQAGRLSRDIHFTGRGYFGPDIFKSASGAWRKGMSYIDMTTPEQIMPHIRKYGERGADFFTHW
jgi:hypothetical protein